MPLGEVTVERIIRIVAAVTGILLAVLSGACADRRGPESENEDRNLAPVPVNRATVEALIGVEGGTVEHPSGARLVIPAGALAKATRLALVGTSAPPAAALGGTPLGQAFRAEPAGQTFLLPVDVVLPFDPTRLDAGSDAKRSVVRMAPSETSQFSTLQTEVDVANRTLRARTVHFTVFVPAQDPNPVFVTSSPQLPRATVGSSYQHALSASGGAAPYQWSLSSGALPPGLSLSSGGTFTGTPTLPSTFSFFARASDATGRSVQIALAIEVVLPNNPMPVLNVVAPNALTTGQAATLTLQGSGFVPSSEVKWNGSTVASLFISANELRATIAQAALETSGTNAISVFSPGPGGGTSQTVQIVVSPSTVHAPVPHVTSVTPVNLPVSATDTQISVIGTDFVPTTSVVLGGQGISTSYVSSTELRATIPASFLSSSLVLYVGAYTPPPGGGFSSNTRPISVGSLHPVPTISSLSPSTVSAGAVQVRLTGTNFVTGGVAFVGSTALATSVQSATSATATVPSFVTAATTSLAILFVNPTPGGGASNSLTLQVSALQDAGADAPSDGGTPPQPDASACGTHEFHEPTQVTVWQDYPYNWQVPRGSTTITSCASGQAVLGLGDHGTSTARLEPGRYVVTVTPSVKPQPDEDPMQTWYYTPTFTFEPAVPPPTNTSAETAMTMALGTSVSARLTTENQTLYYRVVLGDEERLHLDLSVPEPVNAELAAVHFAEPDRSGGCSIGSYIVWGRSCSGPVDYPIPGEFSITVPVGAGGRFALHAYGQ